MGGFTNRFGIQWRIDKFKKEINKPQLEGQMWTNDDDLGEQRSICDVLIV